MRCCMKVYVNYPDDKDGVLELQKAIAMFHATLVMKSVDKLNLDNFSKRKLIKELLEKAKCEALTEEKKSTSVIKH